MLQNSSSIKAVNSALRAKFREAGVESADLSADILLASALGMDRPALIKTLLLNPEKSIAEDNLKLLYEYAKRRLCGEPIAYITGVKEFYGREFLVNNSTLIPRPETELIVDLSREFFKNYPGPGKFADLGTGSGCLAISLALELGWNGLAVDISPEALSMAQKNAHILGAMDKLDFKHADMCEFKLPKRSLNLVVSNPPYVSRLDYAGLDKGVRDFEPETALVPPVEPGLKGADINGIHGAIGTELYPAICALAEKALVSGGLLLLESGHTQGSFIRQILLRSGSWGDVKTVADYAGLERITQAVKK